MASIPPGPGPGRRRVPTADERTAARQHLGIEGPYLAFLGTLEPRKNLGTLVRAHTAARREDPSVPVLVLVGPAGWGDRWQGSPPDPEDVVLAGYLADGDLHAVVAGAAAVCMPSHYEGFGLPVLEAMAAGRPVLASDIPAHREVGGDVPRFFTARAVDELAALVLDVSQQPPGADVRDRGRQRAAAATWTACARATVSAYRRAVA